MQKQPTVLAIDTSFDETAVSVVDGLVVLSNIQPSQMEFHRKYGGVVPSLAKLAHIDRIDNVVKESLKKSGKKIEDIDYFAVTYGPGLALALEVGIKKAKELSEKYQKPLMLVNHMEGHLLSAFAQRKTNTQQLNMMSNVLRPTSNALGILVSGGHTELILMKEVGVYEKIGETLDDSCGECLDKCGRILGLGYPAGPVISKFAKENRENIILREFKDNKTLYVEVENKKNGNKYKLPVPMSQTKELNFSFSGLKTAFNQLTKELKEIRHQTMDSSLDKQTIMDLCNLIEASCYKQLELKINQALEKYEITEILLGGGVIASPRLRSVIRSLANDFNKKNGKKIKVKYPNSKKLTTDNAAMIGIAANINIMRFDTFAAAAKAMPESIYTDLKDFAKIDRDPSLSL